MTQASDQTPTASDDPGAPVEAHAGEHAVAVARAHGVETMFTLSGAHVFPMYDGAVHADPPMRLLDVRHEQTAAFAAEATGKLTRVPGLAVLTAGPGVTNGVSAIAQAQFSGSPLVVVGGRAPANRWGSGSLQELDHPPILAPVTKSARTVHTRRRGRRRRSTRRSPWPRSSHRGPVFLDVPMDEFFDSHGRPSATVRRRRRRAEPDPDAVGAVGRPARRAPRGRCSCSAPTSGPTGPRRPPCGWSRTPGCPRSPTAWAAASCPAGTRCWSPRPAARRSAAPTSSWWSARPWTSGSATASFGGKDGARPGAGRAPRRLARPGRRPRRARRLGLGDLTQSSTACWQRVERQPRRPDWSGWVTGSRTPSRQAVERDAALLRAEADPIHPARIYGELLPRLADDAVVIGDGGDFVSFAGKFVEPKRPGGWLDPGPYGCLGAGLGAAIAARLARPSAQVVLLLGDGAAGMSLMDVDTLVRHDLPVVMVCGNNCAWGLEKGPMQMLYGYDVAADLAPQHPLRRGGQRARRRRRDGHRPAPDRSGPRPCLRGGTSVPAQRHHRRQRRLPAHHLRHLTPLVPPGLTRRGAGRRPASWPWRRTSPTTCCPRMPTRRRLRRLRRR